MNRTQVMRSTTDGRLIAHPLEELEEVVRRDLAYTGYPAPAWSPGVRFTVKDCSTSPASAPARVASLRPLA